MQSVLVTGATGILGSSVCQQLAEKGSHVRAIVRNIAREDATSLRSAGVEVVSGDLADMSSVLAATEGMEAVIHCAAALGRPGVTLEDCLSANVMGTINVLAAASAVGGLPIVQVLTHTFFDVNLGPLTERSPLDHLFRVTDAYTVTKRLAYLEGAARVADGQDIRFMLPGAIYGSSICLEKTVAPNSWNGRLARAIKGEMGPQLPLPIPYASAEDCAYVCVAALEKGKPGQRYIAHGRPEEAMTLAAYCNRACEIANVPHRVDEYSKDDMDDPEMIVKFGPTMPLMVKRGNPNPLFDSSVTNRELDYFPTSIEEGFPATINWLKEHRFI